MVERFRELESVKSDIAELRGDLATLAKDIRGLVRKGAPRQAASALEALQESAEATIASMAEHGTEAARTVERGVKNRPVESLLIAFGLGVLIGNIVRR